MAESSSQFRLAATLAGHSQDVRGVLFPDPSTVLSCSRDTTSVAWAPKASSSGRGSEWEAKTVYQDAHEGFVSAVDLIEEEGEQYVVTGGRDTLIHLWPLHPGPSTPYRPRFTLVGHTSNVCCLSASSSSSTIVSGSWDCTAKIWRHHDLVYTLEGHSAAVWAVLSLGGKGEDALTAAADNLIMYWRSGKQAKVFKGHTQAVRALVLLPTAGGEGTVFASASNDATIRLWSLESGGCLSVLNGHDSFVYSLALNPSTNELVSSGEDRTVRIWNPETQELKQTITLPAISIWTVAACAANGDIVAGSSDNLVRIFTRSSDRLADPETLKSFEDSVAASTVSAATVGDVKKSDLPDEKRLQQPGNKEGQVIMVKNSTNGAVEAHQWSSGEGKWIMVGTVVDGVGSGRRQLFEGREYDYVFDVDIKDGAPPLKLPYNASDNPYTVAQKWLAKNELPDTYVDQIVEFIDKNTGGVAIGSSSAGADPFTGAGSYRPAGAGGRGGAADGGGGGGVDPFTGARSYRPQTRTGGASAGPAPVNGGDPWSSSAPSAPTTSLLPHRTTLSFAQANLTALRGKVDQFNQEAGAAGLSSSDLAGIDALVAFLGKPSGAPPADGVAALSKMLQWPEPKQFPAFDLLRLLALQAFEASYLQPLLGAVSSSASAPSKAAEINGMLAVRALANAFMSVKGKEVLRGTSGEIIVGLSGGMGGVGKNGRVAIATVVLNYSILLVNGQLPNEAAPALVDLIVKLLSDEDPEVVYRSLVALGNVLLSKSTGSLSIGAVQGARDRAQQTARRVPEKRVKDVVAEMLSKAA